MRGNLVSVSIFGQITRYRIYTVSREPIRLLEIQYPVFGIVCIENLKAHANRPNIVGLNNVVTCCIRLHGTTTMLALVAYSLKLVKLLAQQVPTFPLFCDRRNIAQQCYAHLHGIQQCWPMLAS